MASRSESAPPGDTLRTYSCGVHLGSGVGECPVCTAGIPDDHDWREEAWRCYVESGADPDGADARHLNPGEAAAAVKELQQSYDEALTEYGALTRRIRELEAQHGE